MFISCKNFEIETVTRFRDVTLHCYPEIAHNKKNIVW